MYYRQTQASAWSTTEIRLYRQRWHFNSVERRKERRSSRRHHCDVASVRRRQPTALVSLIGTWNWEQTPIAVLIDLWGNSSRLGRPRGANECSPIIRR
jgi:hypothetical protein